MRCLLFGCLMVSGLLFGCVSHPKVEPAPKEVEEHTPVPTTSPGAKFMILPTAVQRTVTAEAGTAEITDISKVAVGGHDVYRIQFRNPEANPTLYVADDGTLASKDLYSSAGAPGALGGVSGGSEPPPSMPPAVLKALQQAAPDAVVASVHISQHTIYEITFQDPATHPPILITEDGLRVRPY